MIRQVNLDMDEYRGLSSDTKPSGIANGSIFLEIDTGAKYMYDAENEEWCIMPSGGGGGGDNTEVISARTGADGTKYGSLKGRLDAENEDLNDKIDGDISLLKSQLEACEAGTSILVEEGYFTDAQKAADTTVGYGKAKFENDALHLTYHRTNATSSVGLNLNDYGMSPDANKVLLDDYPFVVFSCESNIPANVNLIARFWVYVGTTTSNRTIEIPITDRVGNKIILDLKKYVMDLGYVNNNNAYFRGVFSDSFTYTSASLDFKFFGFFTAKQGETYNLALKYENLETRLSSAEEITEKAVTVIGEVNLIDNTKIEPGLLDTSGVVTTPGTTNQQITTDFIPVENGTVYTLQTWVSQNALSDQLVRIVTYDSNKVFIARSDLRTNQSVNDGYLYNDIPLSYDNPISFIRISLNTFGDGKLKLERGNAVSDWTPGLGAVENTQAWNDVIARSIYGIIHRGCGENQTAPENTIPGFIWGKKNGFDFCETDVRYTSDGVAVLLHDASINRTARNADGTEISGTVNIADITYAQALTYDFGIYKGAQYAGTKIPTLEELIVLCKNIGLHPILELKAFKNAETDIPAIFDILKAYRMVNHVSWLASNYAWLAIIKNYDVGSHLCLLTSDTSAERDMMILSMLKTPSNEVTLTILTDFITADLIAEMKSRGISCNAYCPNNETAMLALDEFVTAVTSDKLNYETVRKDSILGTQ